MEATIRTWSQEHWQIVPVFVRPAAMAAGVVNGYTVPETLGADRWAALIAARHTHSGAVCVIDCGTAITIDLLDASGCHRGGLIAPGIGMMKHALRTATAGIGAADGAEQAGASASSIPLARATQEAVSSGVLYMARAMLEHAIIDIQAACGVETAIVMTGGDATRLLPLGGIQPLKEPDLVLNGLAILAGELQCVT
jgi:type III pantothenate kinase